MPWSGSGSICEILFALFRWDKVQRPFEGSPASLRAFVRPFGGWYDGAVNLSFLFPWICLPRAVCFCFCCCFNCRWACFCSFVLFSTEPGLLFPSSRISYLRYLKSPLEQTHHSYNCPPLHLAMEHLRPPLRWFLCTTAVGHRILLLEAQQHCRCLSSAFDPLVVHIRCNWATKIHAKVR